MRKVELTITEAALLLEIIDLCKEVPLLCARGGVKRDLSNLMEKINALSAKSTTLSAHRRGGDR